MAHLLVFRSCRNYVYGEGLNYGTHQVIEREIAETKYPYSAFREGYNIPFGTEWHWMDYRCKKEIIPDFVNDLGGWVINPTPNKISLLNVIFGKKMRSVGRGFLFLQWLCKWSNKFPFNRLHPIKPVPVNQERTKKRFGKGGWYNHIIWGMLEDPCEIMTDKETRLSEMLDKCV